jgi:hypothetical protein
MTPKKINFFVEPTDHGWSVRAGGERVGLFISQRQAVNDAEKRRAELSAMGRESTLTVTGSDANRLLNGRSSRPSWSRRQL